MWFVAPVSIIQVALISVCEMAKGHKNTEHGKRGRRSHSLNVIGRGRNCERILRLEYNHNFMNLPYINKLGSSPSSTEKFCPETLFTKPSRLLFLLKNLCPSGYPCNL